MTKGKKTRRIMTGFAIDEISAVDVPAQEGALMRVVKSADGEEQMTKLDTAALAKRYIDPMDGAVPFSSVVIEEMRCQAYYEAIEDVCPVIYAMETSLKSIAGDSSVPPETKLTMARNTVEDFMSVIRQMWSNADVVMMSALGKSNDEVNEIMTKAKNLEQANVQIADLEKKIEELTKASADASVNKELQDQVAALTAKTAELAEALADETSKAAMTDAEKEYMRSLGADAQREFRRKTSAERKKQMGKSASDDETLTVKGATIRKSVVGDDMFAIMKAQQEEIESARKTADEEREARKMGDYAKMAKESYGNLPGTDIEKAKVLKGLETLPDEVQGTLVKMLVAGDGAIKSAFDRVGSRDGSDIHQHSGLRKNAQHPFLTKVAEIKKRDGIGHAAAMTKARTEDPDGFNDYRNGGN